MGITRREFIKRMVALGMSAAAAGTLFSQLACRRGELPAVPPVPSAPVPEPGPVPPPVSPVQTGGVYMAVTHGASPAALVQTAIKALGGIEQFVKNGDDVIIKPNICVAYHSEEYAATTNPEVVGTLTALCLGAGARRVRVMDYPFGGTAAEAYERSGIGEAVRNAGGEMEQMAKMKYREVDIPDGTDLKRWNVYGDVLDADVLINVPIAKHHGMARLTLGMKNLLGLVTDRNKFHSNLGQRIADLNSCVRPTLTVVDAVRILMNHGPSGGDLNDVKKTDTVIASRDIVAADAYAATLFGLTGTDIPAIRAGAEKGLGTMDLGSIKIEEINV
jgi:uncharacterized protein (DUF362 family)